MVIYFNIGIAFNSRSIKQITTAKIVILNENSEIDFFILRELMDIYLLLMIDFNSIMFIENQLYIDPNLVLYSESRFDFKESLPQSTRQLINLDQEMQMLNLYIECLNITNVEYFGNDEPVLDGMLDDIVIIIEHQI